MVLITGFGGWVLRLGGVGLIFLGLADNSVVPMPGSMDAATIILSAHEKEWWWYYALMATIGGLLGGYVTYALGRKGGKEALEKRVSKQRVEKIYSKFKKGGFGAVMVPALLPPPVPLVPFVLAAGALNYPTRRFLTAMALGRIIRFSVLGLLASIYGRVVIGFFAHYYKPVLWTLLGLAIAGGIAALVWWKKRRAARPRGQPENVHTDAAA